jgi:hypothetical protein
MIDDITERLGQRKDPTCPPRVMLPEILQRRQQGKSLSEIRRLLGFTHQPIGRALDACLSTLENT